MTKLAKHCARKTWHCWLVWEQGLSLIDASGSLSFSSPLNPLVLLFWVQTTLGLYQKQQHQLYLDETRYKLGAFKMLSMYLNSQSRNTQAMYLLKERGKVLTKHSSSHVAESWKPNIVSMWGKERFVQSECRKRNFNLGTNAKWNVFWIWSPWIT